MISWWNVRDSRAEGAYLNIIKDSIAKIMRKPQSTPTKLRTKGDCPLSPLFSSLGLETLSGAIKKKIKEYKL